MKILVAYAALLVGTPAAAAVVSAGKTGMDVQVEAVAGGSRVTMTYKAAGFAAANADKLAPLVDSVLAEQLNRYRDFASPEPEQR